MSDEHPFMVGFMDVQSKFPRDENTREHFKERLRQRFEENLSEAVERCWELPPIILKKPVGPYLELLIEARELFVEGHFYSCVAMCGIVGERLIKDVLYGPLS